MNKKGVYLTVQRQILFILAMVLALAIIKVFLTARLATSGTKLARMETQSQTLSAQNRVLEQKILEFSSLARIAQVAPSLGLVKSNQIVNLTLEVPVALRRNGD